MQFVCDAHRLPTTRPTARPLPLQNKSLESSDDTPSITEEDVHHRQGAATLLPDGEWEVEDDSVDTGEERGVCARGRDAPRVCIRYKPVRVCMRLVCVISCNVM